MSMLIRQREFHEVGRPVVGASISTQFYFPKRSVNGVGSKIEGRYRYGDDRFLSLDSQHKLSFLDVNYHVLALEVTGYFECDIYISDLLRPFVWEGRLFFSFFRTGSFFFGGGWLCRKIDSAKNYRWEARKCPE